MTLFEFTSYLAKYMPIIPLFGTIMGILYLYHLNSQHKSITLYLSLMLMMDILSYLLGYVFSNNNMIVLHIYSLTELAFMIYFFKTFMFRKKQLFLINLGFLGLIYIFGEMLTVFVFKGLVIKDFSPYAKVVDNFIVILFTLAYMSEKMTYYKDKEWGNFRLNVVFLAFFTLNTLFFLPFNFMINATSIKFYFWIGHIFLLILFYMYLTFEIINNGLSNKIKKA